MDSFAFQISAHNQKFRLVAIKQLYPPFTHYHYRHRHYHHLFFKYQNKTMSSSNALLSMSLKASRPALQSAIRHHGSLLATAAARSGTINPSMTSSVNAWRLNTNIPNSRNYTSSTTSSPFTFFHKKSLPTNTIVRFVPQQEAWVVERMGKFHRYVLSINSKFFPGLYLAFIIIIIEFRLTKI